MILVIQKVKEAEVRDVDTGESHRIGPGLLVLMGFEKGDDPSLFPKIIDKLFHLRVFEDDQGKLNLSVLDLGYEVMAIPNFTLAGNIQKGRRPSFDKALDWETSERLYKNFLKTAENLGYRIVPGFFRKHMQIFLVNDGPVTLVGRFPT